MDAAGGVQPQPPLPPPPQDFIPAALAIPADVEAALQQGLPPPPQPPTTVVAQPPPTGIPPSNNDNPNSDGRHEGSDDASGSEHEDSEDEEEPPYTRWQHIEEDKSLPCEDEIKYIESRDEHSAIDHAYWEKQTFFSLNDPELEPVESGRIDWHIEAFNGTKENPNNEQIMRSEVKRIGGLDWQIKFYPKGNQSDYLSCYVECLTMKSPDYADTEDFEDIPFPLLKGATTIKKRRSVAVQLGVVMYNPQEPRVNEYQSEASQFSKSSPDFGWTYFSRYNRYDFHQRQHTQRMAILRDDKLSFSAYIRVIRDPTGCAWEQRAGSPDQITSITGLRPFTKSLQYIAIAVPLMHFAPFRKLVQNLRPGTKLARWLQPLLLKMYTRKRSANYGTRGTLHDGDVVEMLCRISRSMDEEYHETPEKARFQELLGVIVWNKGSAVGADRLNTKEYPSIQTAIDHHNKVIACPALLTLELQRQEHDKKDRKWKKITNKVKVQEQITVSGVSYTLYAFITHCGHLQSSRYNSYVRPKGHGKGWYVYQDGKVTRMTEKEARERHSGEDADDDRPKTPENGYDSPMSEHHESLGEVTSVVMYVRDDVAADTFNAPDEEYWIPPNLTREEYENPPKTAIHESFPTFYESEDAQARASEEAAAQMRARIEQAAEETTPEPIPLDSEGDVVMRDADDDSTFSIEAQETGPNQDEDLEIGVIDWLGRLYYEGKWLDKKFHGGGHLIAPNGDEYIGKFDSGQFQGYGKMVYAATGDTYEGQWHKGERHGKGKLVEHSTGNIFEGNWKEDKKHGEFVLKGIVTEEDKSCCSICFDKEMSTAFYDCGHVVACRDCAAQIDTCPVCRRRVVARLHLYGVRISQC